MRKIKSVQGDSRATLVEGVWTIAPDVSGTEALALMHQLDIHHLPVWSHGKLLGMVSDRDLWKRAYIDGKINHLSSITVSEAMRRDVPVIDEETDIRTAATLLRKAKESALPVMHKGKLQGVLSESDLLALLDKLLQNRADGPLDLGRAEVVMANPLVQNVMKALADVGI